MNQIKNSEAADSARRTSGELAWVDSFTRVLDTKLRIPGTSVRFGLDFILGLVPGAGDLLSLGMSGVLIATMAKNGATPMLVAKMLGNVLLDTVVGTVPILGNVFDLFFKANTRNMDLMREYYVDEKHRGSVWPVVAAVILVITAIAVGSIWLIVKLFAMIAGWFGG